MNRKERIEELEKYVKISVGILLAGGFGAVVAGSMNAYYIYRLVMGITALAVGLWGLKTLRTRSKADAKIFYFGILTVVAVSLAVNGAVIVMSSGLSDILCAQGKHVDCRTLRTTLILLSLAIVVFTICVLIPFALVSKKYWHEVSESDINKKDTLPEEEVARKA